MKIVFISNYFNHHQKGLCDNLYSLLSGDFVFIATSSMPDYRVKLGYDKKDVSKYVYKYKNDKKTNEICQKIIDDADVVIFGSAPYKLIKNRISQNKVVVKYSERINKKGLNIKKYVPRVILWNIRYPFWKKVYLLAASGYATSDYNLYGLFFSKSYKWGYFPESFVYKLDDLQKGKNRREILWCGRFIDWKHPEIVIDVAEKLRDDNERFSIKFVGTGPMEEYLKNLVIEKNLDNYIEFLGAKKPNEVRNLMELAGIYLATSDFGEGWGAVVNEAMNSGCAVVTSHALGSVPYLISHKENGLIYKNGQIDDLYKHVKFLLENPEQQEFLGIKAYNTICDLWNAETAAKRFIKFAEKISINGECDLYKDGPCSKASIIKNNWFTEDL